MYDERYLIDIVYFDDKTCEEKKIKLCTLLNDFKFARTDFVLCSKKLNYYVCLTKDNDPYVVWSYPMENSNPSEVMSIFRNKYLKNNVTSDMLEMFLNDPKKYKKKYLSKK